MSIESKDSIEVKNGIRDLYATSILAADKKVKNPLNTLRSAMKIQEGLFRMSLGVENYSGMRKNKNTDAGRIENAFELLPALGLFRNKSSNADHIEPSITIPNKDLNDYSAVVDPLSPTDIPQDKTSIPDLNLLSNTEPLPQEINIKSTDDKTGKLSKNSSVHSSQGNQRPSRASQDAFSNNSLKIMNIEKRIESRYYPFVARGIQIDKLDSLQGLSFNIMWLVRICAIMFAIACLQQQPLLQVTFVLAINTAFFINFVKQFITVKLFAISRGTFALIIFELTIQMLVFGAFILVINQHVPFLGFQASSAMQYLLMGMVYVSILVSVIVAMIDTFSALFEHISASLERSRDARRANKIIIESENLEVDKLNATPHKAQVDDKSRELPKDELDQI